MANLTIGWINLWDCVKSAKRSKIDWWQVNMRTLGWNLVSQYMFKKFVYEFEVEIKVSEANSLYNLCTDPFQTVIYDKTWWNTYWIWKTCYIEITEEDDWDEFKYQPLNIDRIEKVSIRCEEQ